MTCATLLDPPAHRPRYLAEESSKAAAAVADGADAAESFQQRTQELGLADARGLLAQYMETLVSGRERERSNAAKVAEAEVAAAEASREAQEANYRLRQKEMEFDRRLTELQRDHADKVSALLKQAGYSAGGNTAAAPADGAASRRASSGAGPTDAASLDSAELQRLVRFYKEQMEVTRCGPHPPPRQYFAHRVTQHALARHPG